MSAALLVIEQQSPNLVTPVRFTSLELAPTFHTVGEEAAGGEAGNRAVEVPRCAPQGRCLQHLSPPLCWSRLGMGLRPAAAPIRLEQTAPLEVPFLSWYQISLLWGVLKIALSISEEKNIKAVMT